jgi:hypothetical protein
MRSSRMLCFLTSCGAKIHQGAPVRRAIADTLSETSIGYPIAPSTLPERRAWVAVVRGSVCRQLRD